MSRERELLKRWLIDFGKIHPDVGLIKDTKELLAQPEQEPTTRHALDSYWNQEAYQRGYAEAELKLKREPLSDDEIVKLWANKSPANEFECVRLVEKAHGIGVDDE